MFATTEIDQRDQPGDFAPVDMPLESGAQPGQPRFRERSWLEGRSGRSLAERR